jgi:hypothetical protein
MSHLQDISQEFKAIGKIKAIYLGQTFYLCQLLPPLDNELTNQSIHRVKNIFKKQANQLAILDPEE